MRQTGIITELYLQQIGFTLDRCAPEGVVRYERKERGYTAYYITVTFHDRLPDDIFMLRTDYNLDGGVEKCSKWYADGRTMKAEDLIAGAKALGIDL